METKRLNGKVRHDHVGTLGSIAVAQTVPQRIEFWTGFWQRFSRFDNRLDSDTKNALVAQVAGRIPLPTVEDRRQLQIENAEQDEWLFSMLAAHSETSATEHAGLADLAHDKAKQSQDAKRLAEGVLTRTRDRLQRLKSGEALPGGLNAPEPIENVLGKYGFTKADIDSARTIYDIHEIIGEERFNTEFLELMGKEGTKAGERRQRTLAKRILRGLRRQA